MRWLQLTTSSFRKWERYEKGGGGERRERESERQRWRWQTKRDASGVTLAPFHNSRSDGKNQDHRLVSLVWCGGGVTHSTCAQSCYHFTKRASSCCKCLWSAGLFGCLVSQAICLLQTLIMFITASFTSLSVSAVNHTLVWHVTKNV